MVLLIEAKLYGVEITEVGERMAEVSEPCVTFERLDVFKVDGGELEALRAGGDLVGIDGDGIDTLGV